MDRITQFRKLVQDDVTLSDMFVNSFQKDEQSRPELSSAATVIKTVEDAFIIGTADGSVYFISPGQLELNPSLLYQHTDKMSVTSIYLSVVKDFIASKTDRSVCLWSLKRRGLLLAVSEPIFSMCFFESDLLYAKGEAEPWVITRWDFEDEPSDINAQIKPIWMIVCQYTLIVSDGTSIQCFDLFTREQIAEIVNCDDLIGLRKSKSGSCFMAIHKKGFVETALPDMTEVSSVSLPEVETFMEDTEFNQFVLVAKKELYIYDDNGTIITKFQIHGMLMHFRTLCNPREHFLWQVKKKNEIILCVASKDSVLELKNVGLICDFLQVVKDKTEETTIKVEDEWYCFNYDKSPHTLGLCHLTVHQEEPRVSKVLKVLSKQVDDYLIILTRTEAVVSLYWYQESLKRLSQDEPIKESEETANLITLGKHPPVEIDNLIVLGKHPPVAFFTRNNELWQSSLGEKRPGDLARNEKAGTNIQKLATNGSNLVAVLYIPGTPIRAKLYYSDKLDNPRDITCVTSSQDVKDMQFSTDYLFISASDQIFIWNTKVDSPSIAFKCDKIETIETMLLYTSHMNSDMSVSMKVLICFRVKSKDDFLDLLQLSNDTKKLVSTNKTIWPKKWKTPKLTSDDKFLIMNSSNVFRVLDANDLTQLTQISFHDDQIDNLTLFFDGRFAVIVTTAGNVKLFDFDYGTTQEVLNEKIGAVAVGLCNKETPLLFIWTDTQQIVSAHIPMLTQLKQSSESQPITTISYENWLQMIPFNKFLNTKNYTSEIRNLMIDPYRLNGLHLLVDDDCHASMEVALRDKCPIKKSAFGSPMLLAVESKKNKVLQTLLKHLCYLATTEQLQEFKLAVMETDDALVQLLNCGGKYTSQFINCLFRPVCQEAQLLHTPLNSSPTYRQGADYWIRLSDFLSPENDKPSQLEFHISTLPLPLELGSRDSIDFLRNIRDTTDKDVFDTKLLQSIIKYKWNKLWLYIMATTLLYWVMLGLLVTMIFSPETLTIRVSFGVVNGLMLVYEFMQICGDWSGYVADLWNCVDLVRGFLAIMWAVYHVSDIFTWILVFFCTIRGFSSFRAFESTRYYIRIILDVTKETFPFIIVFLYSISTFGLLYAVSSSQDVDSLNSAFWLSYSVVMGNDGVQNTPLEMTCYFLATLINVVLMLNLLVAVLSEAFERLRSRAIEGDLLEQVVVILEYEELMIWNRENNRKSFFISCEGREELLEDVQIRKIRRLKKELKFTQNQLQEMKNEIATHHEDLKSHISAVKSQLESLAKKVVVPRDGRLAESQLGRSRLK